MGPVRQKVPGPRWIPLGNKRVLGSRWTLVPQRVLGPLLILLGP